MSRRFQFVCVVFALAALAVPAHADPIVEEGDNTHTFEFARLGGNAVFDASSLFGLEVQDGTINDNGTVKAIVLFRFTNAGDQTNCPDGKITDVYWGGTASVHFAGTAGDVVFLPDLSSSGVFFSAPGSPPSAAEVDWDTSFSADGNPPVGNTGIAGGGHGTFYLELKETSSYSSVIGAIGSMQLGIALHAQCLDADGEKSDWFQVQVVPEPTTITLLGFGLAGLVAARRRRD